MHEDISCIDYLTVIAGRKQKTPLMNALSGAGAKLMHTAYGRGSIQATHLMELLGLVPEEHKVLITCLLPNEKTDGVMEMLLKQFHFDKPNTGIAFTMPIEKLSL